ncbi:MAG: alcohol dehydrogenase catalytic domain-containing protein [Fimbriimonadaceae bacterium]
MRLARYFGGGDVRIVEEPEPDLPPGGLLVRTEACGLCSGELMAWYMDRKVPHVLGHEVSGVVLASDDPRFPVGRRVFPHHHAPCLECAECRAGRHVHCRQWRATKLVPGGMAERFAVPSANLNDTRVAENLRPVDAALIEPLACVVKAIRRSGRFVRPEGFGGFAPAEGEKVAVVGLGSMGLMHLLAARRSAYGIDLNPARIEWAKSRGLDARTPEAAEPADIVFVCPGTGPALDTAVRVAKPGGCIVLFAPFPPGTPPSPDWDRVYFQDLSLVSSYSCGPDDTAVAHELLADRIVRAEDVISHFIDFDELPNAYRAMRAGDILKAMVVFS